MISFIIPTFEEGKRLQTTLSWLKQLSIPHEVIISDGGSTDNTVAIARAFTNRVCVYEGIERQKPSRGRNAGAALATGSILVFVDSGCIVPNPDVFFHKVVAHFDNPRVVALTGWLKVPPELARFSDTFFLACINSAYWFRNNVLGWGGAPGRLQIVRCDAFKKVGGYREDLFFYEDVDLFERLSKIGVTRLDPALVFFHAEERARKLGWLRLISLWCINNLWQSWFGHPFSKTWDPVR